MNAPDKCQQCRSKKQPCLNALVIQFECGSMVDAGDGTWHDETHQCVSRQRDQLAARVKELEAYAARLEEAGNRLMHMLRNHRAPAIKHWRANKETKP